jgi:hypothetical protein
VEVLNHIVVLGEQHLRHVLLSYMSYYNETRTHRSLHKRCAGTARCPSRWSLPLSADVCTENLILIDYVTESPNVNGDDRAALLLPDPVRLAVQVEEPT